jgi:hypothetical protein
MHKFNFTSKPSFPWTVDLLKNSLQLKTCMAEPNTLNPEEAKTKKKQNVGILAYTPAKPFTLDD